MEDDSLEFCRAATKKFPANKTMLVVPSFVASVSDQLGVFVPFTMRKRTLLRTIWLNFGQLWNEEVPGEKIVFRGLPETIGTAENKTAETRKIFS